jgi:hypothetical protein
MKKNLKKKKKIKRWHSANNRDLKKVVEGMKEILEAIRALNGHIQRGKI